MKKKWLITGLVITGIVSSTMLDYLFDIDIEFSGGSKTLGVITQKSTLGERELAQRYKIAAKNLGYNSFVIKYRASLSKYKVSAFLTRQVFQKIMA